MNAPLHQRGGIVRLAIRTIVAYAVFWLAFTVATVTLSLLATNLKGFYA